MHATEDRNSKPSAEDKRAARLMPEGRYRVTPRHAGAVKNPQTGKFTYAIDLQFHINGRFMTYYGALTTEDRGNGSAWEITQRAIASMHDGDWDGDIRTANLTRAAYAIVEHEEYQGKLREKVTSVDQSVVERNAVRGDELDQLAEHLREASGYR